MTVDECIAEIETLIPDLPPAAAWLFERWRSRIEQCDRLAGARWRMVLEFLRDIETACLPANEQSDTMEQSSTAEGESC